MNNSRSGIQINWLIFLMFFTLFIGIGNAVGLVFEGYYGLIVDAAIFFSVFFGFKPVRKFTIQAFDFSVMRVPKTYGLIAGSLVLFFITQFLFIGMWGIDDSSRQPTDLGFDQIGGQTEQHWLEVMILFMSIAVLTPIKEEIMYRGIIHRFLEQRHHFWVGLVVSSLIFGLLHIGFPFSAIVMGIIFVLLYRVTNSLIPPITLHIIWNSFVSLLLIAR